MRLPDLTGTPINTSNRVREVGNTSIFFSYSPHRRKYIMKTKVIYTVLVLHGQANDESELTIEVDRNEDVFKINLDGTEVCFGDWTGNLLEAFKNIVHTEKTMES